MILQFLKAASKQMDFMDIPFVYFGHSGILAEFGLDTIAQTLKKQELLILAQESEV